MATGVAPRRPTEVDAPVAAARLPGLAALAPVLGRARRALATVGRQDKPPAVEPRLRHVDTPGPREPDMGVMLFRQADSALSCAGASLPFERPRRKHTVGFHNASNNRSAKSTLATLLSRATLLATLNSLLKPPQLSKVGVFCRTHLKRELGPRKAQCYKGHVGQTNPTPCVFSS